MIFALLALVLAVFGIIRLAQGQIGWGVFLLFAACVVGPGGYSIFESTS